MAGSALTMEIERNIVEVMSCLSSSFGRPVLQRCHWTHISSSGLRAGAVRVRSVEQWAECWRNLLTGSASNRFLRLVNKREEGFLHLFEFQAPCVVMLL